MSNTPKPAPMPANLVIDGQNYIVASEVKQLVEKLQAEGQGNFEVKRSEEFDKTYNMIRNTVRQTGGMVYDLVAALELVKNELIFNNVSKVHLADEFGLRPVPQKEEG